MCYFLWRNDSQIAGKMAQSRLLALAKPQAAKGPPNRRPITIHRVPFNKLPLLISFRHEASHAITDGPQQRTAMTTQGAYDVDPAWHAWPQKHATGYADNVA